MFVDCCEKKLHLDCITISRFEMKTSRIILELYSYPFISLNFCLLYLTLFFFFLQEVSTYTVSQSPFKRFGKMYTCMVRISVLMLY